MRERERRKEKEREKHNSNAGLCFANNTQINQILIRVSGNAFRGSEFILMTL